MFDKTYPKTVKLFIKKLKFAEEESVLINLFLLKVKVFYIKLDKRVSL